MFNMEYTKVIHTLKPFYASDSEVLILGSFPSVKSREANFYYAHPQNRFWKVLACIYNDIEPNGIEEKKKFLLKNRIALWDVIYSCEIKGSSDASIKNVVANDIYTVLKNSQINRIITNGNTSSKLYQKYMSDNISLKAVSVPSTSPANAAYTLNELIKQWSVAIK